MRSTLLTFMLLSSACQSQHSFQNKTVTPINPLQDVLLDISCPQEINSSPIQLYQPFSLHQIHITPGCPSQKLLPSKERPILVMMVLDVTESMQETLQRIKGSLMLFSQRLEKDGWKPTLGAVGFSDNFYDFLVISPTDSQSFLQNLGTWKAQGGGDPQEAGQLAIQYAWELGKNFKNTTPESEVLLIYASDDLAYGNQNHQDTSTDALALWSQETLKSFPWTFAYSVAPKAQNQMDTFAQNSGLKVQKLSYPITQEDFLSLSIIFPWTEDPNTQACQIKNINFSQKDSSIYSTENTSIFLKDIQNLNSSYPLKINIHRCCQWPNSSSQKNPCYSEDSAQLILNPPS